MTKNCGSCMHSRLVPTDIRQRICRGVPPQIVPIPTGPGQMQLKHVWPTVESADEGCGLHKERINIDIGVADKLDS